MSSAQRPTKGTPGASRYRAYSSISRAAGKALKSAAAITSAARRHTAIFGRDLREADFLAALLGGNIVSSNDWCGTIVGCEQVCLLREAASPYRILVADHLATGIQCKAASKSNLKLP